MRIATYNVEWFNSLFDADDRMIFDAGWSGRQNVTREDQLAALGIVFHALDADMIVVIEAPDSHRKRSGAKALERFAEHYKLRANKALIGFANQTQQEIILLYDPHTVSAFHDPKGDPVAQTDVGHPPRFDGVFRLDLDVDASTEKVRFSKPPLEVAATTADGKSFRLIGVHAKSKAPHGARSDDEVMRISISNRRKQLAQCIWIRRRVEQHLKAGESVIVLGDFNDGPGLDSYEKLFGRSGVEIVLGEEGDNCLYDPHARHVLSRKSGAMPATSRFYIRSKKQFLSALLDYIMVSGDLRKKAPVWRIWHPFDDPEIHANPELREALLTASDHFPVSIDIDLDQA